MKMVALIPVRAGSKRCPGKNTRLLAGEPLIYWTFRAAYDSNVFSDIQIWTDDPKVHMMVAERWPVRTYQRAPSSDDEPDIAWVRVWAEKKEAEQFAILRPTSPFRTADTIRRAYERFRRTPDVDSMRAVEPVKQHPGKMWAWEGKGYPITPLLSYSRSDGTPWHSSPTQSLPTFYIQNASLEMAWTRTVTQLGSIAGKKVLPFFTEGYEGFDINSEDDFAEAERIAAAHPELLPHVHA